jgi:UDP-glucose 4-epimerase
MLILITGGAGFIGSHLTEALIKRGDQVRVLDDLSTGTLDNLSKVSGAPGFEFIRADVVQDAPLVRRCVKEADAVIHLAAAVGVELVVKEPARTITTNVHGTENVLTPAAEFGKRVIVASTSEVYGKSPRDRFTEDDDLIIGPSTHSRWSYACSKLLDEFLLMAHCRASKLPGTVVRFFNTVGPRQTGRYGMVIPRFVGAALADRPLQVYGDGKQTRCFCHISDVVEALLLLLDRRETYGQVYNIGSDESISIRDLAERVIRRTGSTSGIEFVPYDVAYAAGFEDMRHRMPATGKIAGLTGWRPRFTLDEIIDDVAAAMRGAAVN